MVKIDAHTQQDVISLRNKLKQLATCSDWHANDARDLLVILYNNIIIIIIINLKGAQKA